MNFDWSDYLKLARELFRQARRSSIREAKLRTAISRAYYHAFIKARNHLRDKDKRSIPRQDAHQYVIIQFLNRTDPISQSIGDDLARLRKLRNLADYEDRFANLASITAKALQLSEQIMTNLGRL